MSQSCPLEVYQSTDPNFEGVDTFQYWLSDGLLQSNVATVEVRVVPAVWAETIIDTAVEDDGSGLFRVFRRGTQDDLWVGLIMGGDAQNGVDYQTIPTVIHFAPGQDYVDVPLVAIPDELVEGSESVTLALLQPIGALLPFVLAQAPAPAPAKVDDRFLLDDLTYSGDKFVRMYKDTPNAQGMPAAYDPVLGGDWLDLSAKPNGNADDKTDSKFPIAFVRDSQVKVQVGIVVKPADFQNKNNLKIRGEGPDGMVFEADAELGKTFLQKDVLKFKNGAVGATDGMPNPQVVKLPKTVKDYPTFTIQWKVFDGQKWSNAGSTVNHLYVLYDTPQGGITPYESLIDIAVRNATGKDTVADIVNAVWNDFKDPATPVKRKSVDGNNNPDGAGMRYWMDRNPAWTEKQFQEVNDLINDTRNTLVALLNPTKAASLLNDKKTLVDLVNVGQCEAWSDLFVGALKAVGVSGATRNEVTLKAGSPATAGS